ncbi:MAG: glycosyltransferase family protein [Candidatus Micrarchaeia archaeon]
MRIHFMINGVGQGHVYRTLPIMKQLAKRHKITASSFGDALRILEENGYPGAYELKPFGDVVAQGFKVNIKQSLLDNAKKLGPGLIKRTSDIITDCRADVVVVDGYLLGLFVAKMLRKSTVTIANCTKLWYVFPKISNIVESGSDIFSKSVVDSSDIIIVPDFTPPFDFSRDNLSYFGSARKFHFVGPTSLIAEDKKGRRPLVSVGGTRMQHKSFEHIAELLDKMGYNPIMADGHLSEEDMASAIAQAPFAVVHGGHTTIMNAVSANTPVISIPLKGYTERVNNAQGAERAGCGVVLDPEFIDLDVLKIAIGKIRSNYIRETTTLFSHTAHAMEGHRKAAALIEKLEEKTIQKKRHKIF